MGWFKNRKVRVGKHRGWLTMLLDGEAYRNIEVDVKFEMAFGKQSFSIYEPLDIPITACANIVEIEFWVKDENGDEIMLGTKHVADRVVPSDSIHLTPRI